MTTLISQSKLEHYNSIKYFTIDNINYSINHAFLSNELTWLYAHINHINYLQKYNIVIPDKVYETLAKTKFQQLLIYIRKIPELYAIVQKYRNEPIQIAETLDDVILLNDPNKAFYEKVLFENVAGFLQKLESDLTAYVDLDHSIPINVEYANLHEYYNILMYAFHTTMNHLDELEFELCVA